MPGYWLAVLVVQYLPALGINQRPLHGLRLTQRNDVMQRLAIQVIEEGRCH